jgi:predicted nucleotidyltransferase
MKRFEVLLKDLLRRLEKLYKKRLVSVVVFGSVGRGVPRPDSDIDILIVAHPLPHGRMARVREFAAIDEAMSGKMSRLAREGIFPSLAPIFKTPEEVGRGSLLFLDMIEDGRVLFDPSGFWKKYMKEFQRRLQHLGAKKVIQGDRWYWDLKPDYQPGDVFEL